MRDIETNTEVEAVDLVVGDKLFDPIKGGTHQSRIDVQWTGWHKSRQRVYVAGIEENSGHPVTLAYDKTEKVKVYR